MPPPRPRDAAAPEAGRLDRVLARAFPGLTRRTARRAIGDGAVFVDGARCRIASVKVRAGARLRLHEARPGPAPEAPPSGAPAGAEGAVLFEDADLLVLDKPPGVTVNESETGGAPSVADRHRWTAPHVVHRLDRDTSGVLVLARHPEAARALTEAFRRRRVEKLYFAIVTGSPEPGVETAAIGRDPRRPRGRRVRPDGKPAETRFVVRSREGELAWVEARPVTGRTHQIRVHLRHRGTPIFGDLAYSGVDRARAGDRIRIAPRTALHARALAIDFGGRRRRFDAPMPADLRALLDGADWDAEVEL